MLLSVNGLRDPMVVLLIELLVRIVRLLIATLVLLISSVKRPIREDLHFTLIRVNAKL